MRKIKLTQGKYALVDDEDFEWLNQWKWTYLKNYNYAYRKDYSLGVVNQKTILMHRLLLNTPKGFDTDHINRNGLDNRRQNLRIVDRAQNNYNSGMHNNNTSGHKGISWNKYAKSWRAYIGGTKTRKELGHFRNKSDAIRARQEAEKEIIVCA